eukprot:2350897-Ditylum_brightwellii.AAC.1
MGDVNVPTKDTFEELASSPGIPPSAVHSLPATDTVNVQIATYINVQLLPPLPCTKTPFSPIEA